MAPRENRDVPREKGARALAVLDDRIRSATDGHRSLEAVFRRLNRRDGTVTYAAFVQTVNEVTGKPMDAWLDRHVAGDDPVTDEFGASSPLTRVLEASIAPLGSGTGGPFFVVAVGLSLAAAAPMYRVLRRLEGEADGVSRRVESRPSLR